MTKTTHIPRIAATHGITSLLLLATSLFTSGSADIAVHDTYFVISHNHVLILIALLYVVFGLITWGMHKLSRRLSTVLNWLHYLITSLCLLLIFVLLTTTTTLPSTYSDYSVLKENASSPSMMDLNVWLTILGICLIFSQLLLVANVIRGFFLKKKR